MKRVLKKSTLSMLLATSLAGAWSSSMACTTEPIMSSICAMAAIRSSGFDDNYVLANGVKLSVSQYTALYSLIGSTYGGDSSNFALPDLRGRVIVGSGQYSDAMGTVNYQPGTKGGVTGVVLNSKQMPTHVHMLTMNTATAPAINGVTVGTDLGDMAVSLTSLDATATVGTLKGSTVLSGMSAKADTSAMTLYAASGGNIGSNPKSASLASVNIYSDATPTIPLHPKSVSAYSVPVNFTGTGAVDITGAPDVTVTGNAMLSGAPGVTVGGITGTAGGNSPLMLMPPYLVMNYYIAIRGYYPTYN